MINDRNHESLFRKGEKHLGSLDSTLKLLNASFVLICVIWAIYSMNAWLTSPIAFQRSGAGLIVLATAMSGFHLILVDRARRIFAFMRNGGIQSGLVSKKVVPIDDRYPDTLWKQNLYSQNTEANVVAGVVRWEVPLAVVGTVIWGYGDWLSGLFPEVLN